LEYFTLSVLAFLIALAIYRLGGAHKPAAEASAGKGQDSGAKDSQESDAKEQPPPDDAVPPAVVPEEGSLAARLHRYESVFAPFASNSAHPRELAEHPQFREAVELLADMAVPPATVMQYALGANWALACAGLAALARRSDGQEAVDQVVGQFDKLSPWAMFFALCFFIEVGQRPPVGAPAVGAKEWWPNNPVLTLFFRDYFERRAKLGDSADFGNALQSQSASPTALIRTFLDRVNHPLAAALVGRLDAIQRDNIDRGFLTSFGRFWADQVEPATLIEPANWSVPLASAQSTLNQTPVRSLLVSGDALVGKTSFLRLLAKRLAGQNWAVFEASGADLMAGQIWFGQLEGRIRRVIDEITTAKKLIWYVPDLLQLARSGTHQGQSASILDQILPAVASGRLVVWTEASPTGTARLLQTRPALRNILEVVRLEPQSEADTSTLARAVVGRLSEELGVTIAPECAAVALASARQYLSASSFPGSALLLLRLTAGRTDKRGSRIAPPDVLATLSQLTGLPVSILDNKERIDLSTIRQFFASRVIGQDEAVSSIIDRIAMLKAGLNDPGRPIGVFLFAGPTGTGKTELAKTTAEYLFGSVERMIRLDMSEFQTAESTLKILGDGGGETDSLINRVRKQPFSVVLLDEFEKSHPRIWDLFLQVFDDGRLTDAVGQVADFRHCLIILTTNLGATTHRSAGLGFAPPPDAFTTEQVHRAISETYRPEFQNRLDRVIVFRPLTRELMRIILKKELSQVLDRRGLKDRAWAVEWEASALEFLLERGFSAEMGARPLKRAIEQFVIAPLAATIVERRFPEGEQFVFFRSDGRAIQAEFVDPDSDEEAPAAAPAAEAAGRPPGLPAMILAPRGTQIEFSALEQEAAGIAQTLASPSWDELKARLATEMTAADFWKRPQRYDTLARFAVMDRVAAAADTAAALRTRLARAGGAEHFSRELISRLARHLYLVREGIRDALEGAAVEVALLIEPAFDTAGGDAKATAAWCEELRNMYRGWSSKQHMQLSELPGGPPAAAPILLITGFGAQRTLERECGLHVLELAESGNGAGRAAARVRLAVTPLGDIPPAKLGKLLAKAFEAPAPSTVARRYRGEPAPLVRSGDGSFRSGRFDAVLGGDFDLLLAEDAALRES
jgi:ATP-dependent Clp protease ATP-binding subunit ClpC